MPNRSVHGTEDDDKVPYGCLYDVTQWGRSGTLISLSPPSDENFNEAPRERMELLQKSHNYAETRSQGLLGCLDVCRHLHDVAGARRYNGRLLFVGELKTPPVEAHSLGNIPTERKPREILGQIAEYMQETGRKYRFMSTYETIFLPQVSGPGNTRTVSVAWCLKSALSKIQTWYKEIFRNDTSDRQIDSIVDQMCLCPNIHLLLPLTPCLRSRETSISMLMQAGIPSRAYPDLLNFDDWSDDDDVPGPLELSSGRSDSGDSDDETGTQET
ncbi:hypothetical protein HFD88_004303 [Aspergillus terreus]|nr:hypothetical protein HFD88_004303 [Aspergillus terreus]